MGSKIHVQSTCLLWGLRDSPCKGLSINACSCPECPSLWLILKFQSKREVGVSPGSIYLKADRIHWNLARDLTCYQALSVSSSIWMLFLRKVFHTRAQRETETKFWAYIYPIKGRWTGATSKVPCTPIPILLGIVWVSHLLTPPVYMSGIFGHSKDGYWYRRPWRCLECLQREKLGHYHFADKEGPQT